jgi:hypothetical protein
MEERLTEYAEAPEAASRMAATETFMVRECLGDDEENA